MDKLMSQTFGLLALIVGVAILAVLVSRQSNTTGVIRAGAEGFATSLGAALTPIVGASSSLGRGGGFSSSVY